MPMRPASELTPHQVDWLWPGYLALGSIAILDGDPGLGKSMLTLDLAARLTTGRTWPDGVAGPGPASVLLLCDEDPDEIILARLHNLGADLPRAYIWPRLTDDGPPRLPSQDHRVEQVLEETGAKLLVIDPIMAFLDRGVDVNSDAGIRRALRPLAQLAERRRCTILMIRHLNKHEGASGLYRGGGSIGFVAACRLAWIAGSDPRIPGRYVLAQQKNNFAAKQPSLAYRLPTDKACLEWLGVSPWSARDLTARRRIRPQLLRACELLQTMLANAPRLWEDILKAGERMRVSERTLRRAKEELDIRSERVISKGQRMDFWLLRGQEIPAGLSDTPIADEALKRMAAQWEGRGVVHGDEDRPLGGEADKTNGDTEHS